MSWLLLLLACGLGEVSSPSPPPEPLEAERAALHEAERGWLREEVSRKLSASDLKGSLVPLIAAERLGGFPDQVERAQELATREDPGLAAQLHAALAEAVREDPERAARHWDRARELDAVATIRGRYGGEATAASLGRLEGVSRELLRPAIQRAVDGHVSAPTPSEIASGGAERLLALARSPGGRRVFPGVAELEPAILAAGSSEVSELEDALLAGERLVEQATELGVPESVAVAEWVEGALAAFDPWTKIAWPAELTGFEVHHSGVEVGVGVQLEPAGEHVLVALPMPDGPAWKAGVHRGDQLLAVVDGATRVTAAAGVPALEEALRGEPGTEVQLELGRQGEPLSLAVARAPVRRVTVHGWTRTEDNRESLELAGHEGLAYLRIEAFRPYTDEELGVLLDAEAPLPDGLVLDLRANAGGDVQAASNIADRFVGEGVVATLEGPAAPPPPAEGEVAWNALLPGDPWEAVPIVVLVDRETASAAEILAGALAGRDQVWLLGERTYGKGWSQGLQTDPEHGFALQLTNAAWHLPDGSGIQRIPGRVPGGVSPDVRLTASAAEHWQNQARRERLEFPRTHADGSPMAPPDRGANQALPVLPADPAVERAAVLLERVR